MITVADEPQSIHGKGRTDGETDGYIWPSIFAEEAVLNEIGKNKNTEMIFKKAAMRDGEKVPSFSFIRILIPPRTILRLSVGLLALENVSLFVKDVDLSDGDLLIGNPVLKHLGVDTTTLLEQHSNVLDGAYCSDVQHKSMSGGSAIVRLVLARQDDIFIKEKGKTPTRSDLKAKGKINPFSV